MHSKQLFVLVGSALVSLPAIAADKLPEITVIGRTDAEQVVTVEPLKTPLTQPGTGELMRRTPGGNLNFNGPMTGIGQYRGLFGYRLKTKVNSVSITSGGPNWMDSPLHYAPMPLIKEFTVQRGVTKVSQGAESIGGYVQANTHSSEFTVGEDFEFHGVANLSAQSVDDGFGLGTMLALSNDTHRMHVLGVVEDGNDTDIDGGKIRPTEYDRKAGGFGYGFTTGDQTIGFQYLRNETGDTGTPALPMDIRFIDSDVAHGTYEGNVGDYQLNAKLFYNKVEHLMDNFSLRGAPMPPMHRANYAEGEASGIELSAERDWRDGVLNFGVDADFNEHDSDISNPTDGSFFVVNFNDVQRDRLGAFVEWETPVDDVWSYDLGLRASQVDAEAGEVGSSMGMADMLANNFNSADRDLDWTLVDAVAKWGYRASDSWRFELTLAHKERAPAYQELYLWLPLQATAGLADGKSYVGNLDLKEEKANLIELGVEYRDGADYIGPRAFYQRIDDYIQGTPLTSGPAAMFCGMAPMCQPPVLQFTNVDAELYGVDTDFGYQIAERWRIDGVVSYVRGKRRDIDDNLYRIAPLSSIVGLNYLGNNMRLTVEGVFAAEQDEVSTTNEETESPGYGYMNLYGMFDITDSVKLATGVNNVFDKLYADHTNGINRAMGSDVQTGVRVPGPGRSFFIRLNMSW